MSIIFWGGTGGLYTTSSTSLRSQLQYAVETCINACKIRQKFIYLHEKKVILNIKYNIKVMICGIKNIIIHKINNL